MIKTRKTALLEFDERELRLMQRLVMDELMISNVCSLRRGLCTFPLLEGLALLIAGALNDLREGEEVRA